MKTTQCIRISGLVYVLAFAVLVFSIGAERNWEEQEETLLAYMIDSGDINEQMV